MTKNTLTFELTRDGDELYISCDRRGLTSFALVIMKLLASEKKLPNDVSLSTEAWGGEGLSQNAQLVGGVLLNRVIVRLIEE